MQRLYLLSALLFFACNENKKGSSLSATSSDSVLTEIQNRSNRYLIEELHDSLTYYLDSILPAVKGLKDDRVELTWLLQKAQAMKLNGKEDSVQYFMKESYDLATTGQIPNRSLLNFYVVYGNLLINQNLVDSAIRIANAAYYLSIRTDSFRYDETCFDLAELYAHVDDMPNMRKYIFEAWANKHRSPELTPYYAGTMAVYYDRIGQPDSAIYFLKRFEEDTTLINISELQAWRFENIATFLKKERKFEEALEYQLKASELYRKIDINELNQYFNLSETYSQLKNYDKAFAYIDSARLLAAKKKDYNSSKLAWKDKAKLYEQVGQFKFAYLAMDSAYRHFNLERDSSLREYARELETQYSVREKDSEIKSLAAINEANLKVRNQQSVIIITMILAILFLAVIGVLLWRRRKMERKVRETDLKHQALRAQMEPHFLFNTLSVLQALIRDNEQEKSILYLNKFARLIRLTLEHARESFVPLKDDVASLESYLDLQRMFYEGKFDFTIAIDHSIQQEQMLIPPMLLQPLAENAILHGFKKIEGKGKLYIQILRMPQSLHFIIDDNGAGLQNNGSTAKRSYATDIAKERLALSGRQTRMPSRLKIIDKASRNEGKGVRVEMDVPYVVRN